MLDLHDFSRDLCNSKARMILVQKYHVFPRSYTDLVFKKDQIMYELYLLKNQLTMKGHLSMQIQNVPISMNWHTSFILVTIK